MAYQSDVTDPAELSDHVIVLIPPDLVNDRMSLLQEALVRCLNNDPFGENLDLQESQATQREHNEDGATLVSQSSRLFGRLWDTYGLDVDLRASQASQRSTFGLNRGSSFFNPGLLASQANQRNSFATYIDLPASQANQSQRFGMDVDLRALQANQRNSFATYIALPASQANQRNSFATYIDLPASQANQRELDRMSVEDFFAAWRRWPADRFREPFGMNVEVPGNLPSSQAYQRRPGDRYTVIGLISTISCAIYSILFGLTGQMYKEEDGSFFSHHRVMVTISMLSMVYTAFSGVFLCVIYYLATADPAHTYPRRMRFLSGTFVSAACFGPAVMFMAMFVGPLAFKVFAWAFLGAALTWVGFYIRG